MLRILKSGVLGLTMSGLLAGAVQPAGAQGFGQPYGGGYGQQYQQVGSYGYPVQPAGDQYPILKKVLIGGVLVGAGFLAGRLTAPKPYPTYNNYPPVRPQFQPSFQPSFRGGHHGHHRF